MPRLSGFANPLMLGFDELERILERSTKTGNDGYPPYNIEKLTPNSKRDVEMICITLAVAGFGEEDLDISIQENQLIISGSQSADEDRVYLYRGIAARQFRKAFILAEGIEVSGAALNNGLLSIELVRIQPERITRKISIKTGAEC